MDDHNFVEMREHLLMRHRAALRAVHRGIITHDACLVMFAKGPDGLGRAAYFDTHTPVGDLMDWVEKWSGRGFNVSMSWDAYDGDDIAARLAFVIETERPRMLHIPPAIVTEGKPGVWQATFILDEAMGDEESISCGVRTFDTISSICGVPNWKCRMSRHKYMPFITRCLWRNDNITLVNALRTL